MNEVLYVAVNLFCLWVGYELGRDKGMMIGRINAIEEKVKR